MPSLWDILCVSRQHKYTTHAKSKGRPHEAWEDPPYYDRSNVEYYIQPELPSRRRTDSLPSQASSQLVHVPPPPRSPSARRNHRVRESPRSGRRNSPAWYVEVRIPPAPSSGRGDVFFPAEAPPLLSRQESRGALAEESRGPPASPVGGSYQHGQQSLLEREYAGSTSGKRRHVKDIFPDMSGQFHDDGYPQVTSHTTSVSSSRGHHDDQVWKPNLQVSPPRASSGSATLQEPKQTSRSWQITANMQTSGFTLPTESRLASQHYYPAQPWGQASGYPQPHPPRQASGYPPAQGSWQSSGFVPCAGTKLGSRSRAPESMHQYSPRTVSDGAISAALMGSRIDDFVHDPGWNRAMDKFAPSPTSTFPFEDKSLPPSTNRSVSSQKTLTPKDSDGNVTFVVSSALPHSFQASDNAHRADGRASPRSSQPESPVLGNRSPVQEVDADSPHTHGGVVSEDLAEGALQSSESAYPHTSPPPGQNIQMFLDADEDVLY